MAAFEVIALDTATPQLRAPGASDTYTFPRAVEMPLGTANGVLYLDGSKAVTSGSALTFNGSFLQLSGAYFANSGVVSNILAADSTSAFFDTSSSIYPFRWLLGGSEQMRLDSTGLGIGTSSPGVRLEVAGTIRSSSSIFAGYASGFDQTYIGSNGATGNGCVMATVNYANNAYQPISYDASVYLWRPNGTEAMRLDSSGNLGLGVTPSAWLGSYKVLQLTGGAIQGGTSGLIEVYANNYRDSNGDFIYSTDGGASRYAASDAHRWFTAASGTAGNPISFTQAMTLDASGNLGVGETSTSGGRLWVNSGSTQLVANFNSTAATGGYIRFQSSGTAYGDIGTAAEVVGGSASDFGINARGSINLILGTNNAERARLDASGNLGLGVTPSAWNLGKAIEINSFGNAVWGATTTQMNVLQNAYWNSGYKYASSNPATYYQQSSGVHAWHISADPTPTAGNAISFTQAMTLDASGNLLVGGTSQLYGAAGRGLIQVSGSSQALLGFGTTGNVGLGFLYHTGTNFELTNAQNGYLSFGTNNTERARIPAAGGMVVGTAALATTATDGFLYVPTCAGTPTGTPTTQTGTAPIVVDTTNNKLYFYSGGQWRDAGP